MKSINCPIIFIYDFQINHSNRGCQALTYGSLHFIKQIIPNSESCNLITPGFYIRRKRKDIIFEVEIDGKKELITKRFYWMFDIIFSTIISKITRGKIPAYSSFSKDIKKVEYVTNICGGDGFADIYSTFSFRILTWPSVVAAFLKKKLIIMPQTIGPFYKKKNEKVAHYTLRNAYKVFVRDLVYKSKLDELNIPFKLEHDVSYYMMPMAFNYKIENNSVGINISGLAYYNSYGNMAGRFPNYDILIISLITEFQKKDISVYLVPHTYNFESPEIGSDDLQATKEIYRKLINKKGVTIVDRNMNAPEVKYVISQFDYFIGTRMHANFAAIYTKVAVFGLAYSYKFEGAFSRYKLSDSHAMVVDMSEENVAQVVSQVMECYENRSEIKNRLEDCFCSNL